MATNASVSAASGPKLPVERNILLVLSPGQEGQAWCAELQAMQPKWRLEPVLDSASALRAVSHKQFDAAVVDLTGAESDRVRLLRQIMEHAPATLRIGLAPPPERGTVPQIDAPAHQLLAKPCNPKVLIAVLARAFATQNFLADETLKKLISSLQSLPVLPAVYTQLLAELQSPEPSLEKAGAIVVRDPGLSAKMLQLVNSAFFGLGRLVADPAEAAMFLGSETLKALVLSLQVFAQFKEFSSKDFSVEALWSHSWATGVLARRICAAEEVGQAASAEAFIAGLLHDFGKLVFATNFPEKFAATLQLVQREKVTMWEAECRIYDASHAEVGGYLLARWGLPSPVVEAVAFHHRPGSARLQAFGPLTAVHVANVLSKATQTAGARGSVFVDTNYLRSLGLGPRLAVWQQLCSESLPEPG